MVPGKSAARLIAASMDGANGIAQCGMQQTASV
jgi:hypothetical protein